MPSENDADLNTQGEGQSGDQGGSKKDDESIPKTQFLAALQSANAKFDALKAEFDALKAAPAKQPEPKTPTEAELDAMVEAGTITRALANAELKRQMIIEVRREAVAAAREVTTASALNGKVETSLAEFKQLVGEAWVPGSAERVKVEAAYRRLTGRGFPDGIATELTALESVYGDLDVLRESKKARRGPSERHEEAGGGSGGAGGGGGSDDPIKGLTAREKAHYENAISRGAYKGWDDVAAERKAHAERKARRA